MLAVDYVHEILVGVTAVLVVTVPVMVRQHYATKELRREQLKLLGRLEHLAAKLNGVGEAEATTNDLAGLRAEMRAGFARLEGQTTERVEPSKRRRPENR